MGGKTCLQCGKHVDGEMRLQFVGDDVTVWTCECGHEWSDEN